MFAAASLPVERPANWRSNSLQQGTRSAMHSPLVSRSNSVSSAMSAQTDPGLFSDRSRQSSATSNASVTSSKSGFKGLFSKKEKKPKDKKDMNQIVLTSKHAATVKTRLMMDPRFKDRKPVKTAGITQTIHTGHLTAAQQEARHPHCGPPALHSKNEMPMLTRIASGDERDEEDESEKMVRVRLEWEAAKTPGVSKIKEHEGDESNPTSAEQSSDDGAVTPPSREYTLSPGIEKALSGESRKSIVVAKNSYGGRFHKDEHGHWKR